MRIFRLAVAAALACGCGGGGGNTTTGGQTVTVASVELSSTTLSLKTGQTGQLFATAKDASGATINGKVASWSSDNDAVATVGSSGLVTGVTAGSANITATIDGKTASALVTVTVGVAQVQLSQSSGSLAVDGTLQLSATTVDAQGHTLSGRTVTWSSSAGTVASVSSTGLVTALSVGSATITATSEGKSATAAITVVLGTPVPFLQKPFAGEYVTINIMDHDTPLEFVDFNGRTITSWGENVGTYDSHAGYDYLMPIGTPIFAAAAGTVLTAESASFFCPILNQTVSQMGVQIVHHVAGGNVYQTYYAHLSSMSVTVGQQVSAGQQIGLSGNTGCTTVPHLHFQLDRITGTNSGALAHVDPYGWTGSGTDPWSANPQGAASLNLWLPGQAPLLNVGLDLSTNPLNSTNATPVPRPVGISKLVFMGDRDDLHPNNEYVELQIDPAVWAGQSFDLTGAFLRTNENDQFNFPAGFTIAKGQTVRVYVGSGTNTATTLYWGKNAGILNDLADCMELWLPGSAYYLVGYNTSCN